MCCTTQDAYSLVYKLIAILYILLCNIAYAQDCSPYKSPKNYLLDHNKSAAIGYVACLHAAGVVAEVGYDRIFAGVLAMGDGHHGATYSFFQYEIPYGRSRMYIGPAYRLNNNPSLLIGRAGFDYRLYKRVYSSASVLQINRNLNYLHVGIKIIL